MSKYQLAQFNFARMSSPLESPFMAEFVANLERINALADAAPGFVWRLQTDDGDATALRPMGEMAIVNMSVWQDVASLTDFVYKSGHVEIMRRRREWFNRIVGAYIVLWWVPSGHRPDAAEGIARLEHLREHGATEQAFNFRKAFPAPDAAADAAPFALANECPVVGGSGFQPRPT